VPNRHGESVYAYAFVLPCVKKNVCHPEIFHVSRRMYAILKFGYKVSHARRTYMLRKFPGVHPCVEPHPEPDLQQQRVLGYRKDAVAILGKDDDMVSGALRELSSPMLLALPPAPSLWPLAHMDSARRFQGEQPQDA
jgi:hypothetical protein